MGPHDTPTRRAVLGSIGTGFLSVVSAGAATARGRGPRTGRQRGFPPAGTTTWGDSATLGDGTVSTFASVPPSGRPQFVGVHLSEGALTGLPSPATLESLGPGTPTDGGVVGRLHGGFWSLLYQLDFPAVAPEPIEFLGLGWNSQGHLPHGVYAKPHFDVHFYFHDPAAIAGIGPRNPAPGTPAPISREDVAPGQVPTGYRLIEGGAVVPKMGAHLAPADAPEFDDRTDASAWQQTVIWGVADLDPETAFELNFVEPMVTVDYFEGLKGVDRHAIAQPEAYPLAGWYPTAYTVRDLGDGGYAVVMEAFEHREG